MKIRVDESYVDALINNAAWDTAKIKLDEAALSPGQKKLDKDGDGKIEGEDLAKLRNQGKGDDKKPKKPEPEKQEESVDEHICPLCESVLEEELSDDQIFEHVNEILGALENLNEEADDEEEDGKKKNDDGVAEAMDGDEEDPKKMREKKKKVKETGDMGFSSGQSDEPEDDLSQAQKDRSDRNEAMMNASKKSKKEAVMKKVKELKKSAKKA